MKKILISNPRYGSTYVTTLFHRYCQNNQKSIIARELGYHKELLNTRSESAYHDTTFGLPLEDRIAIIELYRERGIELLYNIHAYHLFYNYKDGEVIDWFKEFYKHSEIYVLKRKDLWHALLSHLVHYNTEEVEKMPNKTWHRYEDNDVNNLVQWCKSRDKIKVIDPIVNRFIQSINYLNICEQELAATTLWFEEFDPSFLNVETNVKEKPFNLNYEDFFTQDQLSYIRHKVDHVI